MFSSSVRIHLPIFRLQGKLLDCRQRLCDEGEQVKGQHNVIATFQVLQDPLTAKRGTHQKTSVKRESYFLPVRQLDVCRAFRGVYVVRYESYQE